MKAWLRSVPATLLVAGFFLVLTGCAAKGPVMPALGGDEEQRVRQEAAALLLPAEACGKCLDVEAQVVVQSLWQSGTLNGYLLARAPGAFKFVGLSPLGQPLLVLATDGTSFRFVSVAAATVYEGTTAGAAFRRHAPVGMNPQDAVFWLVGRLPRDSRIGAVEPDEAGGYWLTLANGAEGSHRVLFDPAQGVARRAVLLDPAGQPRFEVRYDDYQPVAAMGGGEGCRLPGTVTINSSQQRGAEMTVRFSNWLLGVACSDTDFTVPVPPGFVQERVE